MKLDSLRLATVLALGLGLAGAGTARGDTLFGMVDTGEIFSSTDLGATWAPLSTIPVSDAVALAAGLTTSDLTLVTESGSVYSSADAGVSWSGTGTVAVSDAVDLRLRPDGSHVLLTRTGGVYESTDSGVSWDPVSVLQAVNCVSLEFRAAATFLALTETGEVYRSTDDASSWTPVGTMPVPDATKIRSYGASIYVMTGTGDVRASTDEGTSWTAVGTLSQVGVTGLEFVGSILVAATREGHAATSADGTSWTWQGSINQLRVRSLGVDTPATGVDVGPPRADAFALSAPRPNPRWGPGGSVFEFTIDRPEVLTFALYDAAGRRVAVREAEAFAQPGAHTIRWDPGSLASGVYYVKLTAASGRTDGTRWTMLR